MCRTQGRKIKRPHPQENQKSWVRSLYILEGLYPLGGVPPSVPLKLQKERDQNRMQLTVAL